MSVPSGTVNIVNAYSGAVIASGTLDATGNVDITISNLPIGSTGLKAVYLPDANHNGSASDPLSQEVDPAIQNTVTTLTDNGPNPSLVGQGVSFHVTVANS